MEIYGILHLQPFQQGMECKCSRLRVQNFESQLCRRFHIPCCHEQTERANNGPEGSGMTRPEMDWELPFQAQLELWLQPGDVYSSASSALNMQLLLLLPWAIQSRPFSLFAGLGRDMRLTETYNNKGSQGKTDGLMHNHPEWRAPSNLGLSLIAQLKARITRVRALLKEIHGRALRSTLCCRGTLLER